MTEAKEMVRSLGPGWVAVAVENLGWHAYATAALDAVRVHADRPGLRYMANIDHRWVRCAGTPHKAISLAIADADLETRTSAALVAAVRKVVRP